MTSNCLADLKCFYQILEELSQRTGGPRLLGDIDRFRDWPGRGIYFFFEQGEIRCNSGSGLRVVRVGTHALTRGSQSTLRQRLSQHRGTKSGAGNHRGSIFRLLAGQALLARGDVPSCPSWGIKADRRQASIKLGIDTGELDALEEPVERAVTRYLSKMTLLWLDIGDEPGPESKRAYIEQNAIALLSALHSEGADPQSESWLGKYSSGTLVRQSGLWNQRYVTKNYDPSFLQCMQMALSQTRVTQ